MSDCTHIHSWIYQVIYQQTNVGNPLDQDSYSTEFFPSLKKNTKKQELEAAANVNDKEELVTRQLDEGDLFGVRALEAGYFGGVSQSRPSSPAPSTSSYVLSPNTNVINWGERTHSASSSVTDVTAAQRSNANSPLTIPKAAKHAPSPLRLQPSDAELNGRITHNASNVGGIGGTYMPPLSSPRTNGDVSPVETQQEKGWVSPLDVHFSKSSTSKTSARPPSYLPRLHFPDPTFNKTTLVVPTPTGSVAGMNSEAASVVSSEGSQHNSRVAEPAQVKSATADLIPRQPPMRAARHTQRSIFPVTDESGDRPASRRSPKAFNIPVPPIPQDGPALTIDPNLFPEDDKPWGQDSPVIRDSLVKKQRVSAYKPSRANDDALEVEKTSRSRAHSTAASSLYSTTTSIIDEASSHASRNRSRSSSTRGRDRSVSSHHRARSSSRQSFSQTRDSLRQHSRKGSEDKRRSRDRDQIHYDPTSHSRNRSGSVQGRAVDFDHPRESPFSNSNAISNHSASSSGSSIDTRRKPKHEPPNLPKLELFGMSFPEPDRLSVNVAARARDSSATGRNRSASEASTSSIGDFYDAYYRNSTIAQRASQIQTHGGSGDLNLGAGRKPPPLKLGVGNGFMGETIKEVPSPALTPNVVMPDRYP